MLRLIPHFKNIKWGLLIAKPHSTNLIYFTQPNIISRNNFEAVFAVISEES